MKKKLGIVILFSILAIMLTGCVAARSFDALIELKPNEDWAVTMNVAFDKESVQQYGSMINQTFISSVNQYNSNKVKATWKQGNITAEGTIPYTITISGNGIDNLNNSIFKSEYISKTSSGQDPLYTISIPPNIFGIEAAQTVITLIGGKIVSTNGNKINDHLVQWTNPRGLLTATMEEPKSGIPWLLAVIILIVAFGIIITAIAVLRT